MKVISNDSRRTILSQPYKNTISWIGKNLAANEIKEAGQVFECPDEATLSCIEVFADLVHHTGKMKLTFYEFNEEESSWGSAIASAEIDVDHKDQNTWLKFLLNTIHLNKKSTYGFKLTSEEAFVAIGEAAWSADVPDNCGKEWIKEDSSGKGYFYRHFSLAYKLDLVA